MSTEKPVRIAQRLRLSVFLLAGKAFPKQAGRAESRPAVGLNFLIWNARGYVACPGACTVRIRRICALNGHRYDVADCVAVVNARLGRRARPEAFIVSSRRLEIASARGG